MVWLIEMLLGILFSSTIGVCSVTCKNRKQIYDLGSNILYLSALLLVGKVTNDWQSTYTICPIENVGNTWFSGQTIFHTATDLRANVLTLWMILLTNWTKICTSTAFGVVDAKCSLSSTVGMLYVTGLGGCGVGSREIGEAFMERCCWQL